ncbi:hypothetical protein ACLMAL_32955 [Nocardia sp. CWNU-33]|uniref:hypothetical protein n=1 Tax=Nocardia sp. CWNU-33 TaxID=3392117 RepID=UPI00398ED52C
MDDNRKPSRSSVNGSRELVERLERARNRIRVRRTAAREREKTVTAAVKRYIGAWRTIDELERCRDSEIAGLQQRIAEIRESAEAAIVERRTEQAVAASVIHS